MNQSPPLMRGDYFLQPTPAGTKGEVLARMREVILQNIKAPSHYKAENYEERMLRKLIRLRAKEIWQGNFEASFHPSWQVVGPQLPFAFGEYIDPRMRNYTGKFGHTRSD